MKKKIQGAINSKYFELILVIFINIIFFTICNKLFTFKYEQVDDFIIMNLVSKADGIYSIYGIQMHPIICEIIILLYKTTININWYTIFLLVMQFISFTIIGTAFLKKNKYFGLILYISFIFVIYSKMLSLIQYTTVSMLCITSGFILLMHTIEKVESNINKCNFIISIIMIAFGCMIRFSTIIIAIPFMVIYFICKFIKDKNFRIIKVVLILIGVILLIYISFNIIYNINPLYKEFMKFHEARTYLHDYNWMYYNSNKKTFNSVNWSENDSDIFYSYCFGDEEVFNYETLETLKENALKNTNKINVLQRFSNTFNGFVNSINEGTYKFIFLIVTMLVISNNLLIISKETKDERNDTINVSFINLILITIIGIHCLFIFLNRPMFRVIISIYILGISMLIYTNLNILKEVKKFNLKSILTFSILTISILEFKHNVFYAKYYNTKNYSVYKDILEYTNSHKENAYLYTLVMHDRYLAYSVYEKIEDDTFSNVRPLGDWDTYTENYYNFKKMYNIDNLMKSLYEKDNVYLISGNVIWGESYKEYIKIIVQYIKEHYNINVNYSVIKEFDNNIKIYKLQKI